MRLSSTCYILCAWVWIVYAYSEWAEEREESRLSDQGIPFAEDEPEAL